MHTEKEDIQFGDSGITLDMTLAFQFHCSITFETWKERSRNFGWPMRETIQKVVARPGFEVPVAHSGRGHLL